MKHKKLSVIVPTRNREHAIIACLESIASAFAAAAPLECEIIVVDNCSYDNTRQVVTEWATTCPFPVSLLFEPRPGWARAHNQALRVARGELLAFTDDDCRLHPQFVNDLLRHDSSDTEPVLRGGRIELGDPADLPLTINTTPEARRWSRRMNSVRRHPLPGEISGCNMAMRRVIVEKLGPFDERFGPGSVIGSGADTDYVCRAYTADFTLEYVPDMTVFHHHGRKGAAVGKALMRKYAVANGALAMKYLFIDRHFAWLIARDVKSLTREILINRNILMPEIGFSYKYQLWCNFCGALRYLCLLHSSKHI